MPWRCRGILDWTRDSGSKGCGFNSHQCLNLFSFSKTHYPHCCSPPRCINEYPVGCERYLSLDVACVNPWSGAWQECSPGGWEGALWVQDWYWIQRLGVIIHCKVLWVEFHTIKVLSENQLLLLFFTGVWIGRWGRGGGQKRHVMCPPSNLFGFFFWRGASQLENERLFLFFFWLVSSKGAFVWEVNNAWRFGVYLTQIYLQITHHRLTENFTESQMTPLTLLIVHPVSYCPIFWDQFLLTCNLFPCCRIVKGIV